MSGYEDETLYEGEEYRIILTEWDGIASYAIQNIATMVLEWRGHALCDAYSNLAGLTTSLITERDKLTKVTTERQVFKH